MGRRKRVMGLSSGGGMGVFSVRRCRSFVGGRCSNHRFGAGQGGLLLSRVPSGFVGHRLGSAHCVDGFIGKLLSGVIHMGSRGNRCRRRSASGGLVMYGKAVAGQLAGS